MGQKRKKDIKKKDDYEYDPAPKHLHVGHIKNQEKRLIIILENAQLESVKVRLCLLTRSHISLLYVKKKEQFR